MLFIYNNIYLQYIKHPASSNYYTKKARRCDVPLILLLYGLNNGWFKEKFACFVTFLAEHLDVHIVFLTCNVVSNKDSNPWSNHEAVTGETTYGVEAFCFFCFVDNRVAVR